MSTTSSSRKRPTSSRKTPNRKSNVKSRKSVLQILSSSSDDDGDNNDDEYNNDKTNYNSNDEDFKEEDEPESKVASQIGTQDLLDYPNLHPEFRDSGIYHVINNMKKVNRGVITLPEHSSPFLRCLEAYKEENSKEFIEQLFAWIAVICLDRVHTQGTLKGKDIFIAMGGYVPNILQQLPLMEESKTAVFDHFIDYESTESTGTWPFALIQLIDSYSSATLSKTLKSKWPNHTDLDVDTIKKLNLGWHLKREADDARKFAVDYYNKMWVQPGDLPSGYQPCQLIEAIRLEMIPIVLHRRALANCGRYATSKRERSINLDRMYNNAIAHFNSKVFLPTGWIAWILGGIPVGESKALKVLLVGMETNRRSAAFSSRASRRADRMANAQIGRAGSSASVVDPQVTSTVQTSIATSIKSNKDTSPEKVVHEHFLRMSLNVPVHDQRMKYLKQKIINQQEMLNNYKELEWNISKKDKYNDLIIKQMEAQELYNDLLDKAQQDLFKEDEVLHQDEDEAFQQDRDDLTTSTFDPIKFLEEPINEETVTKKDERTSSTSLKTYVSAEALEECIRQQGVQPYKQGYNRNGNYETNIEMLQCRVLHCKNETYDQCIICVNNNSTSSPLSYEFCVEHFYHCYHENDYLKS